MREFIVKKGEGITKTIENITGSDPVVVILDATDYEEKVFITRENVTLLGTDGSRIIYSDNHRHTTGESAVFTVGAPNFTMRNITVENTYDYISNHERNIKGGGHVVDTQAVAFRTVFGAEHVLAENCTFNSYQDTLFLDEGLTELRGCKITGNVDFFFGQGEAIIKDSTVISNGEGYVAAPSTLCGERGFTFINCDFVGLGELKDGSVYLARPWHPSGSINRSPAVSFISCRFGRHINKRSPWTVMTSRTPSGAVRTWSERESRFSLISPIFLE